MNLGRLHISWTCFRCDDTDCPNNHKLFFIKPKNFSQKKRRKLEKENEQ